MLMCLYSVKAHLNGTFWNAAKEVLFLSVCACGCAWRVGACACACACACASACECVRVRVRVRVCVRVRVHVRVHVRVRVLVPERARECGTYSCTPTHLFTALFFRLALLGSLLSEI